jgi:hypothetical protein
MLNLLSRVTRTRIKEIMKSKAIIKIKRAIKDERYTHKTGWVMTIIDHLKQDTGEKQQ